jgi:hypothetical protein
VIVGISRQPPTLRTLFAESEDGTSVAKKVENINAYLVAGEDVIVQKAMKPMSEVSTMDFGNKADDGGYLTLTKVEVDAMNLDDSERARFVKRFFGSKEFINGQLRYCLWIDNKDLPAAMSIPSIRDRIEQVRQARLSSKDAYARSLAKRAHQFKSPRLGLRAVIITPRVSSENRDYLPVGYLENTSVIGDRNFALYDAPLWNMSIIASRLHWVWVGAVCVRLEMRFSYSNTLGWNTFPLPKLTETNKRDLTSCAEEILIERERYFPATISELYEGDSIPESLRVAHDRNDETVERIYIGRRFKNDTERLEKLFELYTSNSGRILHPKERKANLPESSS